jgi:nitrite reductase/ring-hydroxylating ferredoxin subunit
MQKTAVAVFSELKPLDPGYALVAGVDLVVIRLEEDDEVSVLYGRCLHRGALMADGHIEGGNLMCGVHNWDYCYKSGVSAYNPSERLQRFNAWVEDGKVWVDEDEIRTWAVDNPQPYDRGAYQGLYKDIHGGPEEPHTRYIQHLAEHGLSEVGHHGRVSAMGVPQDELPRWEQIQLLTAQLHKVPLLDEHPVGTEVVIGPNAKKPLVLERPLFVSDMSFGALSEEAKVSLGNRHLLRRGRHVAGGAGCQLTLFVRTGVSPFRLRHGQDSEVPGLSF